VLGRAFKPVTIKKFKGMNTALSGSVPEAYSQDDQELAELINFNTNTDGYLEKRKGANLVASITAPYTPTKLRVVYLQRTRVGSLSNRIFVTDDTETWRLSAAGGAATRLTLAGGPLSSLQSMVEYGGVNSATAYNCTGVRWWPTQVPAEMATGVIGFYGDTSVGQAGPITNSPIGTQISLFKNRGWIINTMGKYNSSGHETKVWYSAATNLSDWGGAALSNFNLDFGDGDFLVAMLPFNEQMFFFKTKKTYMVSADGPPSNWQYRLISDRIGCVGRGTVKVINNIIYFLSVDGVVRTDGVTFQNISDPIRDFFDSYRDYWKPETAMNLYASYWDFKYILWMPSSNGTINTALVFDVRTEGWTMYKLGGGVTALGEVLWDEHYPETLLFGSSTGNQIWSFGVNVYKDNSVDFDCTFTTKKYDFDSAMKKKRNHLVGLSVGDVNTFQPGSITVSNTADDNVTTTRTEVPSVSGAMNVKARGSGYGRYFQAKVQHKSGSFIAVYDLTFMNEDRSFEPKSSPPVKTA
jgi:hypothetical protein